MTKPGIVRFAALAVIAALALGGSGCSREWKKKFVRNKSKPKTIQPILTLEADAQATYPSSIRYQEHFAYWKSWHSELLASFGQIRKRDERYLGGAIGELSAMRELLTGEPQAQLGEVLARLNAMQEIWAQKPESWKPPVSDRSTLERIQRQVNKGFYYSKIKQSMVRDPEKKPVEAAAAAADAQSGR